MAVNLLMPQPIPKRSLATALIPLLACASSAATFSFRHHYIDPQLPGSAWGQTALADIDGDKGLDFITGRKHGPIHWYQRQSDQTWKRHVLGEKSPSDVGGAVLDVDGDGHVDFVTGGAWYRNPGRPRERSFHRFLFDSDLGDVHDVVVADINGDSRMEVVTMSDKNDLRYYVLPDDPTQPWPHHTIGPSVHAGVEVADLDADGDLDVVRSNLWMENVDGRGQKWIPHDNIPFGNPSQPYPWATRCRARDMDGDGDLDLVMTENEIKRGAIAWLENEDGRGGRWLRHDLPTADQAPRGAFHSLAVEDFDGDGDWDVFSCEMEGIPGQRPPRWFIWENQDGRGGTFVEHVVLDSGLGGHEAVVGDVDGDGDLDVCSKLWRPRADNANGGRNHVDFLENLLISKSASQ